MMFLEKKFEIMKEISKIYRNMFWTNSWYTRKKKDKKVNQKLS